MENPCTIVCFGDSITRHFTPILESRLRARYPDHDLNIVNEGVVGETTEGAVRRLADICALPPTVCLIGFGMNDWRKGVNRIAFRRNLSTIIDRLEQKGSRVLLLTMNPDAHPANHDRVSGSLIRYNEDIRDLANTKKIRVCDVFSLWHRTFKHPRQGLEDEIHPNRRGYQCTVEAIMRVVTRSYTTVVWQFNGEECFCNYSCPYCYVPSCANMGHHWRGTVDQWHEGFLQSFGKQRVMFYLSFGEPMTGKNFYSVLDMISAEPGWSGHMTSNLSAPLDRLLETSLVRDGRFFINASFHPTQTTAQGFLQKLLQLRSAGIEAPVVYVMYPPQMDADFDAAFEIFNSHNFLVHVRRFRGTFDGKRYPQEYTEQQRIRVARFADNGTIKYMLNDFEDDANAFKGKLTYAGMYYILVDNEGDVWQTPDHHGKRPLGNVLKGTMALHSEPVPFEGNRDGTVDGLMSFLELGFEEPHGNHVASFSMQGGVQKEDDRVIYGNLDADFSRASVRERLRWPTAYKIKKHRLKRWIENRMNTARKTVKILKRFA
jgi:lysophospholipase L1-like esterase